MYFPPLCFQEPPPPFIKDWYGLFKQRIVTESPGKIMIIDLGTFSCKCAVVKRAKSSIKTHSIESVVAMVSGKIHVHLRVVMCIGLKYCALHTRS